MGGREGGWEGGREGGREGRKGEGGREGGEEGRGGEREGGREGGREGRRGGGKAKDKTLSHNNSPLYTHTHLPQPNQLLRGQGRRRSHRLEPPMQGALNIHSRPPRIPCGVRSPENLC